MRFFQQLTSKARSSRIAPIPVQIGLILLGFALPWNLRAQPLAGSDTTTTAPLTFDRLLEEARRHDPELAKDDAALSAAQGMATQAGLMPNPRMRLRLSNYGIGNNQDDDEGVGKDSIRLMQPLPIGGRLRKGMAVGQAEQRQVEARRHAREQQLAGDLRKAWTLAFFDREAGQAIRGMLDELEKSHAVAQKRFEGLKSPLIDINRVEWEIQTMNADYQKTRSDLRQDLARLGRLSGVRSVEFEQLADPPVADPPATTTTEAGPVDWEARRAALAQAHPSVGAADAAVEMARRELALTRAERIPDLEIGAGLGHSSENDKTAAEFLVEFDLPLFDRKQGKVKRDQARVEEARAEADLLREDLLEQFDEAQARLASAKEQDAYLRQTAIPQNEKAYGRLVKGFQEDVIDFNDYFDAQRRLLRSRVDLLKADRDLLEAYLDLSRLTGEGK